MAGKNLRVGIIGMGLYAAIEHVPMLRETGRVEIVAASRRDAKRLELARRELSIPQVFTDWREMLEKTELDAVVVATPHNAHLEPTLAALDRGLHVLLEKPLATSIADASAILNAVRKSDRVVMMGVNRRGEPSWQSAKRALDSGAIGQVRQISAVVWIDMRAFREAIPFSRPIQDWLETSEMMKTFMLDFIQPGYWRTDPAQMGGDLFADTGSHLVDVMLWLGGASPVEVLAYSPRNRPQQTSIITLQALLSNDVILSITFNDHIAMGDEFTYAGGAQMVVLGDRGRLTTSLGWGSGPAENPMIERNGNNQPLPVEGQKVSPAAAFVSTILDGAPNIATVEAAARVVALIQSAYRSAAERKTVQIDSI